MPKQINVKLGFEADTSQARKQIADLQKSLDGLLSSSIKQGTLTGFDKEVSNAQQSVLKLKTAINNSLNADTGRLDLSKFNTQLNNSGLTLGQLSKDMNGLGADGQKAFLNLANSIVTAQKPMVESNKLLDNMWTALKNTARWQLSSSLLHGFMGALQGAYGYAQDLNKSLTDIAIVTGRSTDQMAAFAEQANKSAQALSVSTTAYTDAALIYYQQGLSDDEVKARTDITMQMSNVTGESAEHVSSYMTAIWNNFAEGSENLDHFADVITALGAATASSSEEIANGMQQFAAVADTVGLSYEYAATALATVVAQTRQSESTVGNSFRTIFSRLQGLKLGETLEDGTSLNKYSNALATIGVNIKDQNGELKEMDTILNEIGAKWQTLTKDQQVALAQTVGGVRQYTNLIALFDNWDTFQENLQIANNSDGALQKQADIYAESWEAAQKRVRAAWQAIYQDLISDKFFITILNGLEAILHGVDGLIDSLGGLPGVLSGIGVLITSVFNKQLVEGLRGAQQQLKVFTGTAQAENDAMVAWTNQYLQNNRIKDIAGTGDIPYEDLENELLKQKLALTIELREVYDGLNDAQKQYANILLESVENQQRLTLEAKKTEEATRRSQEDAMRSLKNSALQGENNKMMSFLNQFRLDNGQFGGEQTRFERGIEKIASAGTVKEQEQAYNELYKAMLKVSDGSKEEAKLIENVINKTLEHVQAQKEFTNQTEVLDNETDQFNQRLQELVQSHHNGYLSTQELIQALETEKAKFDETSEEAKKLQIQIDKLKNSNKGVFGPEFAQSFVNTTKGISQLSMGFNSLKTAWDTIKNPDVSGWQKVSSTITSLSFGIPAIINGFKSLGGLKSILSGISNVFTIGAKAKIEETNQLAIANAKAAISQIELTKAQAVGNLVLKGYDINTAENIVNTQILAHEKEILAAKEKMVKAGLEGTNTAALASKAAMWELYLVIGLVIAAIALWNKQEKDKEQGWKDQDKAIQDTTESAKELINAYDELKNKLEELQGKKKALKDLEKGTEEYQAAVAALNAQMLELIETYGLVEGKDFVFNDGVIDFTNSGNKVMEAKTREQRQTGYARQMAALTTPDSSGPRAADQINKIISSSIQGINETNKDAFADAYLKLTDSKTIKALSQTDMTKEGAVANLLAQFGIVGDMQTAFVDLITSNGDLRGAIEQLSGSMQENTAAQAAIKAGIYDRFGSDIGDLSANYLTEKTQELYDENYQNMGSITEEDYIRAGYKKNADNEWEDENGNVQTLTDEMIRSQLAYLDALNQLDAQYKNNLDTLTEEARQHAQEEVSNNFNKEFGPGASDEMGTLNDAELSVALNTDLSQFQTVKEAIDYIKKASEEEHHLELKVNADDLSNFKGKTKDLEVEVQELSEFIKRNTDNFANLSEHIAECDAIADQFAYSLIRFDDALQDVEKNYKDWSKVLKSTNKNIVETKEVTTALRKTYGNLLDMDGSRLSEDFVQNSENLDIMNQILTGTEEEAIAAYDALSKIAAMDIAKGEAAKLGIEFDEASFNSTWDTIMSEIDRLRLEAGDPIDMASPDFSNLVAGLNQMLALVGGDVEAAKALFAQLGFQAEFENVPVNKLDREENIPVTPEFEEKKSGEFIGVSGQESDDGLDFSSAPSGVRAVAYGISYVAQKATEAVAKSTTNVSSLKIKDGSLHYIGGGSPKITNMPAKTLGGGGGGGSCFAAGTKIVLKDSQKTIENIKPGDLVLSYNEKTHKNEFSKVVQTMIHNVYEKIYNLFVKNDRLVVTGNHRFLITRNNKQEWIQAVDIKIGDLVLLSTGELCKISGINIEKKFLTVYNFEVSNTHNYYVGENHILAHNKGGGGGGSKAKKKKVEKKKEPTKNIKEADRYHNIKEKIEDLNTEMKRLNENKDRAYGKDRIKWMDEEIKKTEEQIKLTDEYIDEIKSYAKIDKEDLKNKLGSFISDADFDENGVLKDYEGLLAKIQGAFDNNVTAALNKATAEYNAAVDRFNASDQEDDATEEFEKAKEAWDKAKESYDKQKETYDERLKALKQYEETINLLQEKEQERIDQLNELYDKWLARTTYKVEISLEMNEDDMNYLQWVYDNLGDSADKAADRISLLSKQMKTTQKDIATYKKGIEELFAQNGMDVDLGDDLDGTKLGERLDQLIQKMREQGGEPNIQEVIDKLSEYRDGLMDTYDTMRDLADAATENVVNAYDEWNERLQENLDLMDHYDSVIDTIKEIADLLGEDQLGLGDEQAKTYEQAKLDNQRNAAAIAKDNYDAIAKERERVQKLLETSESETEKKHWEEVLKNLQEAENEAMEEYLSRWRDALRQAEENYQASLDRNEKAYQKAMSGGMGTLDMLQEQFDRQKELDDLYLDDYEKYKKLGDITSKINKNLANNPSPMIQEKMKDLLDDVNAKMENGADISEGEATILEKRLALLEAEDQLLEARNAKSAVRMTRDNEGNFSYTYTADTSKIEEAQQNYADKFYELLDYEKQYSDETQGNMLKSWQDFINKRNEILEDDMLSEDERNKAMERLQADYDKMVAYYSDELNMVMEEMSRLKTDDWKDMENILGRLLAGPEDFETDLSKTTLGQLTNAWSDPEGMAKSWRDAADTLYTQDADARAAWVAANEETNRRVDTSTKEFAENYKSTLGEIVEASDEVADSAEKMAEEMPKAMTEVLNEAENFFNEFGSYIDTLFTNIQNIVKAINELKDVLAGVDPEYRTSILGNKVSKTADYELPVKPVSGATGMYTGEWGTGGKLAILHEKELLLNEADTQNILKAVDFVRNMPQFGGVLNINNNVDYSKLAAVGATDLQQQVHIDASFPNVESHTEIELALNNLINSASQYVNRK